MLELCAKQLGQTRMRKWTELPDIPILFISLHSLDINILTYLQDLMNEQQKLPFPLSDAEISILLPFKIRDLGTVIGNQAEFVDSLYSHKHHRTTEMN